MYSLCHFYKIDFFVCSQQGFSAAENYARYYPPMSKFHKETYLWEANCHFFSLSNWQ